MMNQSKSWHQWYQRNMYIRKTLHPAKIIDELLYEREFIMLGIIITWYVMCMYKDASMCQMDKGRILTDILGFQFMI